jgi:hypothetical protein
MPIDTPVNSANKYSTAGWLTAGALQVLQITDTLDISRPTVTELSSKRAEVATALVKADMAYMVPLLFPKHITQSVKIELSLARSSLKSQSREVGIGIRFVPLSIAYQKRYSQTSTQTYNLSMEVVRHESLDAVMKPKPDRLVATD